MCLTESDFKPESDANITSLSLIIYLSFDLMVVLKQLLTLLNSEKEELSTYKKAVKGAVLFLLEKYKEAVDVYTACIDKPLDEIFLAASCILYK